MPEKYFCNVCGGRLVFMADYDGVDEYLYWECSECEKQFRETLAGIPIMDGES